MTINIPANKKVNIPQLRQRLHDLWVAGDDNVGADYRDLPASVLCLRYLWVANMTEKEMGMARGEIAAAAGKAVLVAEGEPLLAAPPEPDYQPDPVTIIYAGLVGTDRTDPEAILAVLDLARAKCVELVAWNARKRNSEGA